MHNFIFRSIVEIRENYWFLPSTMTVGAVLLGFALPYIDSALGSAWLESVPFMRAVQVDGARAILTTLAGAMLGVAGVAFSVTMVAVSFASSTYGPRLIGNFMGDRTNQTVLGILVATFVYCITVLSTVHARLESSGTTLQAFVPQISVYFALVLALGAVGALIVYIHHIPESINIMNLTATIGEKLHRSIVRMLDEEYKRRSDERNPVDLERWQGGPRGQTEVRIAAEAAGFLQQLDLKRLVALARKNGIQIRVHRSPGDFLVTGETIMSAHSVAHNDRAILRRLRGCYTQGANRTDVQDVLFLSDQLVEVLARALSAGVNDPQTAMLCLNWLRAALVAFACRVPAQPATRNDPVLYRRVSFEEMLDQSFDRMRQYAASDRNVTLHALGVLADIGAAAAQQQMAEACIRQMRRLTASAKSHLDPPVAHEEIEAELSRALGVIASASPGARAGLVASRK